GLAWPCPARLCRADRSFGRRQATGARRRGTWRLSRNVAADTTVGQRTVVVAWKGEVNPPTRPTAQRPREAFFLRRRSVPFALEVIADVFSGEVHHGTALSRDRPHHRAAGCPGGAHGRWRSARGLRQALQRQGLHRLEGAQGRQWTLEDPRRRHH